MRFHILKSSTTKFLLISDSQTQYLNYPNLNILSIPCGKVCHARNFLPNKGAYDIIIIFIGGNDLFEKTTRAGIPVFSSVTPVQVANELIEFAEEALLTKKVYVLAIPFRFDGAAAKKRVSAVNELLRERAGLPISGSIQAHIHQSSPWIRRYPSQRARSSGSPLHPQKQHSLRELQHGHPQRRPHPTPRVLGQQVQVRPLLSLNQVGIFPASTGTLRAPLKLPLSLYLVFLAHLPPGTSRVSEIFPFSAKPYLILSYRLRQEFSPGHPPGSS